MAALDGTYSAMRDVLTQRPGGLAFYIYALYPDPPTRVLAIFLGFVVPAAACRWGSRVPGTLGAKLLFAIAAAGAVAVAVRAVDLSWQFGGQRRDAVVADRCDCSSAIGCGPSRRNTGRSGEKAT